MEYDNDTRGAYRTATRAESYKRYHTSGWSWGRIATWFEQNAIRGVLARRSWSATDTVLDAPCGTGILGPTLAPFSQKTLACDISLEMMKLADGAYAVESFGGFVQTDIAAMPFRSGRFPVVITLGFMHRVPSEIRRKALCEIRRVCSETAIVSYSHVSPVQRLKHRFLRAINRGYLPAPCAISADEAEQEIREAGFHVIRRIEVLPILSSESLYVLSKLPPS